MLRSSLVIIVLWYWLHLLVEIDCQATPFKPELRRSHTATLINGNLYILGGLTPNDTVYLKDFFYLDFSVPFNTKTSQWQDLTNINIVPPHGGAASVRGGANDDTLILYGGYNTSASVYTFDSQSKKWSIPAITGENIRKTDMAGVVDQNKKMYVWGGLDVNGNDSNSMVILDTINFRLSEGSLINAPNPRINYGGVLLPDQTIVYIGGFNGANKLEISLDVVSIYNTNNDTWVPKVAPGTVPSARDGFSATLGFDKQRIIIFGGSGDVKNTYIPPGDTLYELDLTNYQWRKPQATGNIPSSRNQHRANLVGRFIVISFGTGYSQETENDIILLDIGNTENYTWTENFDPSLPTTTASPTANVQPLTSGSSSNSTLIGAIAGSLIGVVLLIVGSFFLYKWYKRKKESDSAIQVPGSEVYQVERNFHNQGQENIVNIR